MLRPAGSVEAFPALGEETSGCFSVGTVRMRKEEMRAEGRACISWEGETVSLDEIANSLAGCNLRIR